MKKIILSVAMLATTLCFSQWTTKTIDSQFDGKFKKAYTKTSNNGFLAMEKGEVQPFFYLRGSYFCDDTAEIDIVFEVNGQNKKHTIYATKSKDSNVYYFEESSWTENFISDFKNAHICYIRVNQEYCQDDYYVFNMSGSTAAYNFIMN
jgi:hypothetical protein